MQTTVSTKGQVVIPGPLRRKLGVYADDPLDADIDAGRIVLTPPIDILTSLKEGDCRVEV
jgi:AbrB family looped-hinge helix DNA binding protein